MSKESRDAYIDKMHAKMKEWNADIDKLKGKVDASGTQVRENYTKRIEELKLKRDAFKARIQKLSKAGEDSWEELKSGTEKSWNEIRKSLDEAVSRFKHKSG